nr:unnamed protein product [Spirometra erinaceieuropaei]
MAQFRRRLRSVPTTAPDLLISASRDYMRERERIVRGLFNVNPPAEYSHRLTLTRKSCLHGPKVVCSSDAMPEGVAVGSAVSVRGRLVLRPQRRHRQHTDHHQKEEKVVESPEGDFTTDLVADVVRNLSGEPSAEVGAAAITEADASLLGAMSASRPKLGLLRSDRGLAWRHRVPEMAAALRLRAVCKSIVHRVMQERAYLEVDTPILTRTDCEGAGETFLVKSTKPDLTCTSGGSEESPPAEHTDVHLTVSAQLHLEALALGMGRVYTLSPTFRAEPSHSRFHLAEFLMLEAESVLLDSTDTLCTEMEAIVTNIVSSFLGQIEARSSDLSVLDTSPDMCFADVSAAAAAAAAAWCYCERFDSSLVPLIFSRPLGAPDLVQTDLRLVLSYLSEPPNSSTAEHIAKLRRMLPLPFARVTFTEADNYLQRAGRSRSSEDGLSKEEEQEICQWVGDRPVFITDFPASMKPFYCASTGSVTNGSPACVQAVDLLIPGIGELIGGSVRETDGSALAEKMRRQGLNPQSPSMAWYLGLRGHGGAPHAGFGLGFDRLLLWILGVYNIRDTVPFPRELQKIYM